MKTATVLAVALVAFTSIPLLAQQAEASIHQNAQVTADGARANERTNANAQTPRNGTELNGSANSSAHAEMRPVNTELESKLDAKHAKVGDPVVVKTTERTTTADGTVLPKGTRLVGHIASVQAHSKESENSQMAIQFDRAELKGGQTVAIQSEIRSIAPPPNTSAFASTDGPADFGGSPMAGGGRVSGGGRVGGGLLGGGSAAVGGFSNAAGRVGTGLDAGANDSLRATDHVAGDAAAGLGKNAKLGTNAAGGFAMHETAIPGLMLAGDASGRTAGMLSSSKQNVHLESGTQMVLGIAAAR